MKKIMIPKLSVLKILRILNFRHFRHFRHFDPHPVKIYCGFQAIYELI